VKIIIGLGNPGADYQNTRHNAGMMLVDKIYKSKFMNYEYGFRRKKDIFVYESDTLVLVKTSGLFMNESGRIIQELRHTMGIQLAYDGKAIDQLYVAHDDLDIKLGEYKIQMGKGPKEHNGVNSVEQILGTDRFWRIRIGIDNRNTPVDGETYVLQTFIPEEREILTQVLGELAEKLVS